MTPAKLITHCTQGSHRRKQNNKDNKIIARLEEGTDLWIQSAYSRQLCPHRGWSNRLNWDCFLFYLRGSESGHNTVPRTPDEGKALQNALSTVRTEASPSFRVTQGCSLWVPLGQALLGQIQLSNCWSTRIQNIRGCEVRTNRKIKSSSQMAEPLIAESSCQQFIISTLECFLGESQG